MDTTTFSVRNLNDLIKVRKNQISSKNLINNQRVSVSVFSFSSGEIISEESYHNDMLYFVIQGKLRVVIDGNEKLLAKDDTTIVKKHLSHKLISDTDLKMIQVVMEE